MNSRLCLCLPVFDNPKTLRQVVQDCLETTAFPVRVFDDGSQVPAERWLEGEPFASALKTGRLRITRWEVNRGKGQALQRAFAQCTEEGFTHALTLDTDGQHPVSEVPKLVEESKKDPWALIIGCRNMGGEEVPESSRFGRAFSNFWARYQTGVKIHDSQSGLRLYPLLPLQTMRFWTSRYDFEIEVLIRLIWTEVPVREVPVAVVYPPRDERVSHFRKFRDNARISALNTVLVVLSLLRSHISPSRAGLAVGLGVFIGCSPFYGVQTLIAAGVAFALRLNAPLLCLGTQISIPPLAPFLALLSMRIGYLLIGKPIPSFSAQALSQLTFRSAFESLTCWLIGGAIVGSALGLVFGGFTYWLARQWHVRRSTWTGKTRGGVMGHAILKAILRTVGLKGGYFVLYFIVPYFYAFAPRARRSSRQYWRLARPQDHTLARERQVMRHFHDFARVLMDRLYQTTSRTDRFVGRSEGFDNIRRPLTEARGVLMLSVHAGAWDLAAAYAHQHGPQDPFNILQYENPGTTLEKVKGDAEVPRNAYHFVNHEQLPILKIHRLLGEGKAVALMGDRPLGKHYELVRFFGKLAPFDATPFRIAAATGKPIVFTFGFRAPDGAYDFFASPERHYRHAPNGGAAEKGQEIQEWVQELATAAEAYVRRYPTQWFNFFPFWSSVPKAPSAELPSGSRDQRAPRSTPTLRTPAPSEVG